MCLRSVSLAILLVTPIGCGSSREATSDPPGCAPVFAPASSAAQFESLPDEVVLLFPEEGMIVQASGDVLVSGRALGDFSGGIEINGQAAQVTGNAFHGWIGPTAGSGVLDVEVVTRHADGSAGATATLSVDVGEVPFDRSIGLSAATFAVPEHGGAIRQLFGRACGEEVLLVAKTVHGAEGEALRAAGLRTVGILANDARIVIARREALLGWDDESSQQAGIRWIGAVVPEMKHARTLFDAFSSRSFAELSLGDSIAEIPSLTVVASHELRDGEGSPAPDGRFHALVDQVAPWEEWMSDDSAHTVLELGSAARLAQEQLVQWLEPFTGHLDCPDCEGCPCTPDPCASTGGICEVLFEGATCQGAACVRD